MNMATIFTLVEAELEKARYKFPSNKHLLLAFVEESGEVTKAFLDSNQGKADGDGIVKELVQTVAMAIRLLQEGDPDFPIFNRYLLNKSLDIPRQ